MMAYVGVMEFGPYKHALYKCDVCGKHYNCNGVVFEPGPLVWCEPYNDEYCHQCFVKVPGAIPAFSRIEQE